MTTIIICLVISLAGFLVGYTSMSYVYGKEWIIPCDYFRVPYEDPRVHLAFDTLCINVLERGDTASYRLLRDHFHSKGEFPSTLFYYSLAMIKKHRYSEAYYDAYESMMYPFDSIPEIWQPVDTATYSIAMSFLEEGAKANDPRAKKKLQMIRQGSRQ